MDKKTVLNITLNIRLSKPNGKSLFIKLSKIFKMIMNYKIFSLFKANDFKINKQS